MNVDGFLSGIAQVVAKSKAAEPDASQVYSVPTATEIANAKSAQKPTADVVVSLSAAGMALSKAAQSTISHATSTNNDGGVASILRQQSKVEQALTYEHLSVKRQIRTQQVEVASEVKVKKPQTSTQITAQEAELKSKVAQLSQVQSDESLSAQQKQNKSLLITREIASLEQELVYEYKSQSNPQENTLLAQQPGTEPVNKVKKIPRQVDTAEQTALVSAQRNPQELGNIRQLAMQLQGKRNSLSASV